jgi:hypothetical protein
MFFMYCFKVVHMRGSSDPTCPDNSFQQFRKICDKLRDTASYLAKSELLERFFRKGAGTSFEVNSLTRYF